MTRGTVTFAFALLVLRPAGAKIHFEPASEDWGLEFHHHHGGCGEFFMIETMGSGVVIFDYDGDGDKDAFFVDSGGIPRCGGEGSRSRLFRNDGDGRFTPVTEHAGIVVETYGMGATAGDVDGDGDLDLYVTGFGANQLFVNDGDGTFTDVTESAGVGGDSWSTSAAFGDADNDGDLDLYVANYVDFSFADNPRCGSLKEGLRSYCHPAVYDALPDRFYRNGGTAEDGGPPTFEDASAEAGFAGARGKGLGVAWSDFDADGWSDLYVANDMTFNFQFQNGGPTGPVAVAFEDVAILMGTAVGDHGKPEAGMGLGIADLDGDGLSEIFVTHLDRQTNALYVNRGGRFSDRRFESGLAEASLFKVGFGAAFADFDDDGDLDLAVANGHIIHNIERWGTGSTYRQKNQIFENTGGGRFRELTDAGLDAVRVSRGLAVGDLDGDADLDLVITNSDDLAEVYRNESPRGSWLRLDLETPSGNAQAVGTRVELRCSDRKREGREKPPRAVRELRTASSYLSQNEMTMHFGLAPSVGAAELTVHLPGGRILILRNLPRDRRLHVRLNR